MRFKSFLGLASLLVGFSTLSADVSEMIFYPEADFSEGVLHFNYQGEKNKNYGFMFDKGYDQERILYVRPENYVMEKQPDGMLKLLFLNTDRYSYMQRVVKDDFLVTKDNGVIKILLSGGDCVGSSDCVTAENILTVNVPNGYDVLKYQGLDQDLKPLKKPKWQRKGNIYTLIARDVKGACIMMELEKAKSGLPKGSSAPIASRDPKTFIRMPEISDAPAKVSAPAEKAVPEQTAPADVKKLFAQIAEIKPVSPAVAPTPAASAAVVSKPAVVVAAVAPTPPPAAVKPSEEKQPATAEAPAPYFRNFQIFESRVALSEAGKERLREWAALFKAGNYKTVVINSYTDNIPPQRLKHLYATNEILSAARAQMVADYLATVGIDSKSITVNGKGDADPVASNETEEGRSKNRRVEFVLTR